MIPLPVLLYLAAPWAALVAGGVLIARAFSKHERKQRSLEDAERAELDRLRAAATRGSAE
jgi:cytochrome c-type biogenesis protein CcmH/NrfF